jgi:hypothetical protein
MYRFTKARSRGALGRHQEKLRRHEASERASINRIRDEGARRIAQEALPDFNARHIRQAEAIGAGRKSRMRVKRGRGERRYTPQFNALIQKFHRYHRRRRVRHSRSR